MGFVPLQDPGCRRPPSASLVRPAMGGHGKNQEEDGPRQNRPRMDPQPPELWATSADGHSPGRGTCSPWPRAGTRDPATPPHLLTTAPPLTASTEHGPLPALPLPGHFHQSRNQEDLPDELRNHLSRSRYLPAPARGCGERKGGSPWGTQSRGRRCAAGSSRRPWPLPACP